MSATLMRQLQPFMLAAAALTLGILAQRQLPGQEPLALAFYAVAAATFLWSVLPVTEEQRLSVAASADALRPQHPIMVAAVALVPASAALLLFHFERWLYVVDFLWVAAIAVVLVGAFLMDRARRTERDGSRASVPWRLAEVIVVGAILLLAFGLRTWQMPNLPPVFEDEGHGLRDAHLVLDGVIKTPFTSGHSSTGTIFEFCMAGFMLIGFSGEVALKLTGIVPGVLAILFLYLLLREWFGREVAAIGAFLMATSSWQLMVTRWGHVYGFDELFAVAALYFIARGIRTLRYADFAFAGLSFGFGLVLMKSASTAPLMLAAVAVLLAWHLRTRAIRAYGPKLALLLLTIAVVAAPRVLYVAEHRDEALERPREVFLFNDEKWAQLKHDPVQKTLTNAKELALAFNYDGGFLTRWNVHPNEPAFDVVTAALLVLGIAITFARCRDWRFFLLLALGAAVLLPAATAIPLDDRPVTYRLVGAVPLLYGAPALAAWLLYSSQGARWSRAVAGTAIAALLATSAWINVDAYFNGWGDNLLAWYATGQVDTRVGREVDRLGDGYEIFLWDDSTYVPTVRAIAWGSEFHTLYSTDDLRTLEVQDDGRPWAFLLVERHRLEVQSRTGERLALLQQLFPGGVWRTGEADPTGKLMYSTYYLTPMGPPRPPQPNRS
jgi:hypothetical protein